MIMVLQEMLFSFTPLYAVVSRTMLTRINQVFFFRQCLPRDNSKKQRLPSGLIFNAKASWVISIVFIQYQISWVTAIYSFKGSFDSNKKICTLPSVVPKLVTKGEKFLAYVVEGFRIMA